MAPRKPQSRPATAKESVTPEEAIAAGDREGALKLLAKRRLRAPDDPSGYTLAIGLLRQAGREEDAGKLIAAARKRPGVASALADALAPVVVTAAGLEAEADAAMAEGGLAEAARRFAELRARFPGVGSGWLRGAEIARATGDLDAARALLDEILARFSGNAGMMAARAYLLRDLGDLVAAAEAWAIVRAQAPELPDGWVHGCYALFAIGRADEAEAIIAAGIAHLPGNYALLAAAAYLAEQRGDLEAARRRWRTAKAAAADPREANTGLARVG